jgi:membrane fusion protein, copper/silver efflux system
MKNKNIMIIIAVLLFAGLIIYVSKAGLLKSPEKKTTAESSEKQNASGHEGHTPDTKESEAKPDASEEQETPTIEITPEKQQLIGVKIAEVAVRLFQRTIRTVGRIEYDERKIATVNTKIEGWIEKLYVDYTGRYVKKGEALAEIFSPELIATQQEFINAFRWTKQSNGGKGEFSDKNVTRMLARDAETIVEASRQRLRLWDISEEQIKKIEDTGKPIRTITLFSPVSGYVTQKMAVQGMKVMPGEKLFDVADLSSLWVIADIYEYELSLMRLGQKAKITLSYFPDKEFFSQISYIYPSISGTTRTAKVRFEIANSVGQLKPQMFSNVEIKVNMGKKLAIPDDAVIDTGTRQVVYVDKGEGYFEPREVMLGMSVEGFREVIKGLKSGEKIAASATFLIDSEAQLKNVTPLGGHKH